LVEERGSAVGVGERAQRIEPNRFGEFENGAIEFPPVEVELPAADVLVALLDAQIVNDAEDHPRYHRQYDRETGQGERPAQAGWCGANQPPYAGRSPKRM